MGYVSSVHAQLPEYVQNAYACIEVGLLDTVWIHKRIHPLRLNLIHMLISLSWQNILYQFCKDDSRSTDQASNSKFK